MKPALTDAIWAKIGEDMLIAVRSFMVTTPKQYARRFRIDENLLGEIDPILPSLALKDQILLLRIGIDTELLVRRRPAGLEVPVNKLKGALLAARWRRRYAERKNDGR